MSCSKSASPFHTHLGNQFHHCRRGKSCTMCEHGTDSCHGGKYPPETNRNRTEGCLDLVLPLESQADSLGSRCVAVVPFYSFPFRFPSSCDVLQDLTASYNILQPLPAHLCEHKRQKGAEPEPWRQMVCLEIAQGTVGCMMLPSLLSGDGIVEGIHSRACKLLGDLNETKGVKKESFGISESKSISGPLQSLKAGAENCCPSM